jgi:hypothetical protein
VTDHERATIGEALAALSAEVGGLKAWIQESLTTLHRQLDRHDKRLDALEEARIRAEERERTMAQIRAQDRRDDQEREAESTAKVTIGVYRWQAWAATIAVLVVIPATVVALTQLLH